MGRRVIVALLVVLSTVSYLVYSAIGITAKRVVTVAELSQGAERKNVRLGARVADREIEQLVVDIGTEKSQGETRGIRFYVRDIVDAKDIIAIEYHQVMPESLRIGRDVIVEGDFIPKHAAHGGDTGGDISGEIKGTFTANSLVTQCPSKYVPPTPGSSDGGSGDNQKADN